MRSRFIGASAFALRRTGVIVLAFVFLQPGGLSLEAAAERYLVLQAPGCANTVAWAVNNNGDVVGQGYQCGGDSGEMAFVYRAGVYSTIDVPGAAWTTPTDINDRADIVGYYRMPDNQLGAFLLRDGIFVELVVSSAGELVPQGVNNRGDITGWLPTSPYQAFLLTRSGDFRVLSLDGADGLQAWKINSSGAIVGSGYTVAGAFGFVWRHGEFEVPGYPGYYRAINDRGDIAAEVPGFGYVVYRRGAVLDLGHPEKNYTLCDLSNRWAVGALAGGQAYRLALPADPK